RIVEPPMSTISDIQDFSEFLRARYQEMRRAAPDVLRAVGEELPASALPTLHEASSMFESTLAALVAAAEELRVHDDAPLAARGMPTECRVRVSARRDGEQLQSLQWIITEGGDQDCDLL